MEKKTIFRKAVISVIVRKKFHINMCIMKSEVYRSKVDTQDELLARILDAAANTKNREYQLRRTTRHLHTRVTNCTEIDDGTVSNICFEL